MTEVEVAEATRYGTYSVDFAVLAKRFGQYSLDFALAAKRFGTYSLDQAINSKRFGSYTVLEEEIVPAGVIYPFAGPVVNIPAGYLHCNGASLLRASYPALFSAIGTTYGAADGSHFNIPDFRNKLLVGAQQDDSGIPKTNIEGTLKQTGGGTSYSHANGSVSRGPSGVTVSDHSNHTHPYGTLAVAAHSTASNKQGSSSGTIVTTATHSLSGSTGNPSATLTHTVNEPNSGAGHDHTFTQPSDHTNVVPPYVSTVYIIKVY